ncbi:helix-turn-helix domain-containing protein [Streptomyces sp. AA8]|nr:helix-turn-helix domain-containing protein [Streptomyces telluris]
MSSQARRHDTAGSGLPRLFTPADVAEAIGCSAWWVKEQARQHRVPFTRLGGAYRFTAEHFAEIIRLFEERPPTTRASVSSVPVSAAHSVPLDRAVPISAQLRPRPPRRSSQPRSSAAA